MCLIDFTMYFTSFPSLPKQLLAQIDLRSGTMLATHYTNTASDEQTSSQCLKEGITIK